MSNLAWADTIRAKLPSTANNNMRLPRRAPLVLSTTTRARISWASIGQNCGVLPVRT